MEQTSQKLWENCQQIKTNREEIIVFDIHARMLKNSKNTFYKLSASVQKTV